MIELLQRRLPGVSFPLQWPAQFDAVITDPPYASGGATLAERSASTSQKYTATKKACRSRTSWATRWMRVAGCT